MKGDTKELNARLREKYDALDGIGVVEISPSYLADSVLSELDPESVSPTLVSWAAALELRQLARAFCAERQTLEEHRTEEIGQTSMLFVDTLQRRYPTDRDGEKRYVLRQSLTYIERLKNIGRLQHEAGAKKAHADALQAETDALIAIGELVAVE